MNRHPFSAPFTKRKAGSSTKSADDEEEYTPETNDSSDFDDDEIVSGKKRKAPPKAKSESSKTNRRLRNREAAHQFRQRQKMYILDLETRIAELNATNTELQNRLRVDELQNSMLREHLKFLRMFVEKLAKQHDTANLPPACSPDITPTDTSSAQQPTGQGMI